ncbi:MAG: hypothetical protein JSW12_04120 [Deltaproteobacteria bacterium]|nr:MAG: hypothetical protein JSW12_04120 [Deltaproteobacteria bacterium]
MKTLCYAGLTFLLAVSLLAGCITLPTKGASATKSSLKGTEEGLYSKVPAAMRAPVREAEFDLEQAKSKAELAGEEVKLAELQKEKALLEEKYAGYGMQLAEINKRKAELEVEIRKFEAIDNANLGDKEDNIRQIANLKTKKLNIESDGIRVKADFDTTELKIKKLTKQIKAQETKVLKTEKNRTQTKKKVSAKKTKSK